jgi:carbamoyl-phosphate synthase large subunit
MKKAVTVFFSSAGRRVGLVECFRKAARELNFDIEIIAGDLEPRLSAACHVADIRYQLPPVAHPGFVPELLALSVRHRIDLLIPTIDPELIPLSIAASEFAKIGCRVHVSPPETIAIVRDKLKTMSVLARAGAEVPATVAVEEYDSALFRFPVFLKPRSGSAGKGVALIEDPRAMPSHFDEPMIVQEYLPGAEYTVNAFSDCGGSLRSAITHRRLRVRAGEVEKGLTERHLLHAQIARRITAALPDLKGAFCFQLKEDLSGIPKIIEINARFGGGYPLADRAGAPLAKWLLQEAMGETPTFHDNWRPGVLMLRYDDAIFVESDDEYVPHDRL